MEFIKVSVHLNHEVGFIDVILSASKIDYIIEEDGDCSTIYLKEKLSPFESIELFCQNPIKSIFKELDLLERPS